MFLLRERFQFGPSISRKALNFISLSVVRNVSKVPRLTRKGITGGKRGKMPPRPGPGTFRAVEAWARKHWGRPGPRECISAQLSGGTPHGRFSLAIVHQAAG